MTAAAMSAAGRVGRQHVLEPELAQPLLGRIVTGGDQPHDGDPGRRQPGQRIAVEPS